MLKKLKEKLKWLFYTFDEKDNLKFDLTMVAAVVLLTVTLITVIWKML